MLTWNSFGYCVGLWIPVSFLGVEGGLWLIFLMAFTSRPMDKQREPTRRMCHSGMWLLPNIVNYLGGVSKQYYNLHGRLSKALSPFKASVCVCVCVMFILFLFRGTLLPKHQSCHACKKQDQVLVHLIIGLVNILLFYVLATVVKTE